MIVVRDFHRFCAPWQDCFPSHGLNTAADFDSPEETAYQNLYQQRAGQATDELAVTILQGRCVGGRTTLPGSALILSAHAGWERTVVDSRCQSHDVPGLFVIDGSVLPTSLGVNPQCTNLAIAERSAEWIVDNYRTING